MPLSWLGSASFGASFGISFGATSSFGGGGLSSLRIFMSLGTTGAAAGGGLGFASITGGGGGGGSGFTTFSTKVTSTGFSAVTICLVAAPMAIAATPSATYSADDVNNAANHCRGTCSVSP